MPSRAKSSDQPDENAPAANAVVDVVPSDQAIAVPEPPAPPEHPVIPVQPTPGPSAVQDTPGAMPAANAPRRAHWKGNAGESIAPLLIAERDADGNITERIYYTPARDLSDDEWNAMDARHKEYVRGSALYDVQTNAAMKSGSTKE